MGFHCVLSSTMGFVLSLPSLKVSRGRIGSAKAMPKILVMTFCGGEPPRTESIALSPGEGAGSLVRCGRSDCWPALASSRMHQRIHGKADDAMSKLTGAQYEILVDGKPRSYRDTKAMAIHGAEEPKQAHPHGD